MATPEIEVTAGLTRHQFENNNAMSSDIIETNGPLTMDTTRNRMNESMSLIEFVHDYKVVKKVYDRVVSLIQEYKPLTRHQRH